MSLNEKQKLFCEEYLIDLNGTQAAIRAGYSKNTANEQSAQLLAKLSIQEYITELKTKRLERIQYSQDDLLKDLIEVKKRCMQAVPVPFKKGVWKFDSNGANKALDSIAKHIGFYATDNKQKQLAVNPVQKIYVTQEQIDEVNKHIDNVINENG